MLQNYPAIILFGLIVLGIVIGAVACWFVVKDRSRSAVDVARSEVNADLAVARERNSSLATELKELATEYADLKALADGWRDALDTTRDDRAQLAERASRVEMLDANVLKLTDQIAALNRELQSSTSAGAQQAQLLKTEAIRIQELTRNTIDAATQLSEAKAALQVSNERGVKLEAELNAERLTLARLREEHHRERDQRVSLQQSGAQLAVDVSELRSTLEAERASASEKLTILQEARESLSLQFKTLANEILEEKGKRFSEQNQTSLGQLLDPLKIRLAEFQNKVEDVYVKESKDRSAMGEQVRQLMELNQSLGKDARNLTRALKGSSKTQGTWGELVLERVLEASGLRKAVDYEIQESHSREDGSRAQPDVIINLPEGRHLVVDAKVSLVAYEDCVAAETDDERQLAVKQHIDSVRAHIKGLSAKNYQDLYKLKSLDFVVMFVPIEPAFMLVVTHDRDLFMDAWAKNVLLVSPSTLLFVVRTIAHLWRQEAQDRNALEIAKRGAELYDHLCGFVQALEKVGERLNQAQASFADAKGKLSVNKGNVIRQAEMLRNLGVKPSKALPAELLQLSGAVEDGPVALISAPSTLATEINSNIGN